MDEEVIDLKEVAEKYKQTAAAYKELAQDMLKAFVFIEERLQSAAGMCLDMAEMLDPSDPTIENNEGESNVN